MKIENGMARKRDGTLVKPTPKGRPRIPPELNAFRLLNKYHFGAIFSKYAFMTEREMQFAYDSPDTEALEKTIITAFRASHLGEFAMLGWMLNKVLGRPSEKSLSEEQEIDDKAHLETLSKEELLAAAKSAVQQMEAEIVNSKNEP